MARFNTRQHFYRVTYKLTGNAYVNVAEAGLTQEQLHKLCPYFNIGQRVSAEELDTMLARFNSNTAWTYERMPDDGNDYRLANICDICKTEFKGLACRPHMFASHTKVRILIASGGEKTK